MSKQSFLRGKFVSRFAHDLSREHIAGFGICSFVVLTDYQAGSTHPPQQMCREASGAQRAVLRRWWRVILLANLWGKAKPRSRGARSCQSSLPPGAGFSSPA